MNERRGDVHSAGKPSRPDHAHAGEADRLSNRIQRFTVSERTLHWLVALAFFSLLISGLIVGRRGTFHEVMYAWRLAPAGVLYARARAADVLWRGHGYSSTAQMT